MLRTPLTRFKESTKDKNLWVYILFLGKDEEVIRADLGKLLLEKFDFLPNAFRMKKVFYRLHSDGYITKERYKSQKAYKTTEKGKEELQKMISYTEELLEKLKK
jgi:DNA-binding PadR family transcriptional regulator